MPAVKGQFDVKVRPESMSEIATSARLHRNSLDKVFYGPLAATSQGEMLAAMGEVKGSAAYVAIERVTGRLDGREGEFALYHVGTMQSGVSVLAVSVVPDSGMGALSGITGAMTIDVRDGVHFYEFVYELAGAAGA